MVKVADGNYDIVLWAAVLEHEASKNVLKKNPKSIFISYITNA